MTLTEDLRKAILEEAAGGPKAKGIATYDTNGRLIRLPKAIRSKGWKTKKKAARRRTKASRRKNRR